MQGPGREPEQDGGGGGRGGGRNIVCATCVARLRTEEKVLNLVS